jgi:hypothetical protein
VAEHPAIHVVDWSIVGNGENRPGPKEKGIVAGRLARRAAKGRSEIMTDDAIAVARARYEAYVSKNRTAIEALIAPDFRFTSPLDNAIDRATHLARCWPNSEHVESFHFIHLVKNGDRVFVTYEGRNKAGNAFRNTEIVTVRGGQITDVEFISAGTCRTEPRVEASWKGSAACRRQARRQAKSPAPVRREPAVHLLGSMGSYLVQSKVP